MTAVLKSILSSSNQRFNPAGRLWKSNILSRVRVLESLPKLPQIVTAEFDSNDSVLSHSKK
jgi:hypothetical protein